MCDNAPRAPPVLAPPVPAPTGGFGAIDFVSFTPKDSKKLLSDVPASDYSKKRARREAEAPDKRRKQQVASRPEMRLDLFAAVAANAKRLPVAQDQEDNTG